MNPSGPQFHAFESAHARDHALAHEIVDRLHEAIADRGSASLVATGGTTAGGLYDRLSRAPLAWDHVNLTLSDERWVDPSAPESNEGLVRRRLLKDGEHPARLVPLKTAAKSPEDAEAVVHWKLAAMPRPFDVVLLGMGADGHVASLFAGAPGLEKALDVDDPALARAMRPTAAAGSTARMSLTLRALLDARFIAVILQGQEKRQALRKGSEPGAIADMPVRGLLRQDAVPVHIYWAP
jgi:6-phosphogluconolactonase